MTFSGPVQIAGQTLPAGTYVFETAEFDRNLVIVKNRYENQVIGSFQTIPIEIPAAPNKVRVEFSESPANSPESIHAWFYPGDPTGWEFLTPKNVKNAAQPAD
jgi:hypothetical protein